MIENSQNMMKFMHMLLGGIGIIALARFAQVFDLWNNPQYQNTCEILDNTHAKGVG